MKLYHRTNADRGANILLHGFKDHTGTYLTDREWTGVWLSDRPLDINDGIEGGIVLCVELNAAEGDLSEWEWIEEGKTYREWLIPAAFVNGHQITIIVPAD